MLPWIILFVLLAFPDENTADGEPIEPGASIHLVFKWLCVGITIYWYFGFLLKYPLFKAFF